MKYIVSIAAALGVLVNGQEIAPVMEDSIVKVDNIKVNE